MSARAIVSVHDVAPETLPRTAEILARVEKAGQRATLLVICGRAWDDASLDALRRMQARGHALAGHGWSHRAERIRGLRHRAHSWLLSRHAAEHLALPPSAVVELVHRCRDWFPEHGFEAPALYVPPAWALGLGRAERRSLPFRFVETLTGFHDLARERFEPVPLIGFEADTRARALGLTLQNRLQRLLARWTGAIRVAIHPHDAQLRLARALENTLGSLGPRPAPALAPR